MAPEILEKTEDTADTRPAGPSAEADGTAAAETSAAAENGDEIVGAAEGEAKEKKGLSKLATAVIVALSAVILTTVILLIVMFGGSGTAYTQEDIGLYSAVAAQQDGVTADISGLFSEGFSIELRSRGKCKINLNGELISGKWSCIDGALTVSGGGVTYSGRVADGVMLLENVMQEGISLTLKTAQSQAELPTERAGKYYISSFSVNGQIYEGDMLETAGFGGWYIELDDSGSGTALMFSTEDTPLIWSSDSISCTSGLIIPYSYSEGSISLDYAGMSEVTFKNDAALDPFKNEGVAGELKADTLECGSLWRGTLSITGHEGEGALKDGSTPVYGFLCKDSGGGTFFELYESSTRSGTPLMSYWVEIKDGSLVPVIGDADGWLYDYWLTKNDAGAFTMTLKDSAMELLYKYSWQNESCNIDIKLEYAGME